LLNSGRGREKGRARERERESIRVRRPMAAVERNQRTNLAGEGRWQLSLEEAGWPPRNRKAERKKASRKREKERERD
jgi:hypothetical protein